MRRCWAHGYTGAVSQRIRLSRVCDGARLCSEGTESRGLRCTQVNGSRSASHTDTLHYLLLLGRHPIAIDWSVAVKIPVFVSGPTSLNPDQKASRAIVMGFLEELNLEPRALGRSDYPSELPLREVLIIAKHCAGGIILGYEQFQATAGTWKRGIGVTAGERKLKPRETAGFPSPWNQLEAGILFGLGVPLLIFRETGISGGVFDNGVTDVFIHPTPAPKLTSKDRSSLKEVFLKWHARASARYYGT